MKQSNPVQAILFDLDGTLIDTAPDFFTVLQHMIKEDELPSLDYDQVRNTVSDGARALINLAYKIDEGDHGFVQKKQALLDLYLAKVAQKSRLFEGLDHMVNWLFELKIPMAIVTNKPRLYTQALLDQLYHDGRPLATYIHSVVCPDDVKHRKPHPEPLLKSCKEMKVDPKQCIYVGDHIRDIKAGKSAGMKTIAAAYGYVSSGSEAAEWQADWTITNSNELLQLLKTTIR